MDKTLHWGGEAVETAARWSGAAYTRWAAAVDARLHLPPSNSEPSGRQSMVRWGRPARIAGTLQRWRHG
jgi:hypothetical protein